MHVCPKQMLFWEIIAAEMHPWIGFLPIPKGSGLELER